MYAKVLDDNASTCSGFRVVMSKDFIQISDKNLAVVYGRTCTACNYADNSSDPVTPQHNRLWGSLVRLLCSINRSAHSPGQNY